MNEGVLARIATETERTPPATPMSRLVLEIVLGAAYAPDVFAHVELLQGWLAVERGEAALDYASFDALPGTAISLDGSSATRILPPIPCKRAGPKQVSGALRSERRGSPEGRPKRPNINTRSSATRSDVTALPPRIMDGLPGDPSVLRGASAAVYSENSIGA
ncbi:MAG TPA: hypothetical protein VKM54_20405 [Myxococcota bacterium]|nr:hypothetical protein [Myxococcota bacterium]